MIYIADKAKERGCEVLTISPSKLGNFSSIFVTRAA
jgi:hypothetical protein